MGASLHMKQLVDEVKIYTEARMQYVKSNYWDYTIGSQELE